MPTNEQRKHPKAQRSARSWRAEAARWQAKHGHAAYALATVDKALLETETELRVTRARVDAIEDRGSSRDRFALAALAGLLATDDGTSLSRGPNESWQRAHARVAYELADAMLVERAGVIAPATEQVNTAQPDTGRSA